MTMTTLSAHAQAGEEKAAANAFCTPPKLMGKHVPFQPTYTLSEKQTQILAEFREIMHGEGEAELSEDDILFMDDACLCRYLRARDWVIAPAKKLLLATLKWRAEYGIREIDPNDIAFEMKSGKNYVHGTDSHGRPVIYQRPRRENSKDYKNQVKLMAYLLERATDAMDRSKGVEQITLCIDFKGYSMRNAPPMSVTKEVLGVLMDKYPERLGAAYMIDAPFLFSTTYNIIKPFLPKATKAKINFVKRKKDQMPPGMCSAFEPEALEEEYFGLRTSNFDPDAYVAACVAEVNERNALHEHAKDVLFKRCYPKETAVMKQLELAANESEQVDGDAHNTKLPHNDKNRDARCESALDDKPRHVLPATRPCTKPAAKQREQPTSALAPTSTQQRRRLPPLPPPFNLQEYLRDVRLGVQRTRL